MIYNFLSHCLAYHVLPLLSAVVVPIVKLLYDIFREMREKVTEDQVRRIIEDKIASLHEDILEIKEAIKNESRND